MVTFVSSTAGNPVSVWPTGYNPVGTIYTGTTASTAMTLPISSWLCTPVSTAPWSSSQLWQQTPQVYVDPFTNRRFYYYTDDVTQNIPPEMWQQAVLSPVVHRSAEDLLQRDEELFRQAVAMHDHQEAERLNRIITQRLQESAERQRQTEEIQRRAAEADAIRNAANDRARELLFEHLNPSQRETFESNGWFIVEGGRSKTRYRIRASSVAGNIQQLDQQDRVTHNICCHVPYDRKLPSSDQHLAQKIMLELAEDDFMRLANRHAASG